jgi:hypothetical protein
MEFEKFFQELESKAESDYKSVRSGFGIANPEELP